GRADLLVSKPDKSSWKSYHYLRSTGSSFELVDTNVPLPLSLADQGAGAATGVGTPDASGVRNADQYRYADIDGDGVADAIACAEPKWKGDPTPDNPSGEVPEYEFSRWTYQLWKPANGATPAGFEATP